MLKHLVIRVFGRVVGVGFRWEAKQQAEKLKLAGLVRNEPDESLYLEAEGEEEALAEFLAWCKTGPPFAQVERVEPTGGRIKGYVSFVIEP